MRYDIVNTLQKKLSAAQVSLRGFRIEVTVQNLFTTISSKTCTEHVHNFSHTVPYTIWFVRAGFYFYDCLETQGSRKLSAI